MLKIRSGIITKDSLYVIAGGTDRLTIIDISGDSWSVYDGIDLEVPHSSMTYWDLFYCDEKIYYIPNNGTGLGLYDPKERKVEFWNQKLPKNYAAGIYRDRIYLIPERTSDKLFYFDTKSELIQEDAAWSILMSQKGIQGNIFRYYFSAENEIVFTLRDNNGFFSYNIKESKIFRYPLNFPIRDVAINNGCYYYLANIKGRGIVGKVDASGIIKNVYEKEKQYAKHFIKYKGGVLAEIGSDLMTIDDTVHLFSEGVCDNSESSSYISAADCSNRSILLPWSQDSFAEISNTMHVDIHSVDFLNDKGAHIQFFTESKSYALKGFIENIVGK